MSPNLDQQSLDLINAWGAGAYLHPAQRKAALQVAIRAALAQARAEGLRQAAEVVEGMSRNPVYGTEPSASVLVASGHVAARLRALAEGGE